MKKRGKQFNNGQHPDSFWSSKLHGLTISTAYSFDTLAQSQFSLWVHQESKILLVWRMQEKLCRDQRKIEYCTNCGTIQLWEVVQGGMLC